MRSRSRQNTTRNIIALLAFGPLLVPLGIMVSTAFTNTESLGEGESVPFFGVDLGNFVRAWNEIDLLQALTNTLILVVLNVAASVLVTPIIAYGLVKVPWAGSRVLLAVGIAIIVLPFQVTMLPLYFVWDRLGLVGTLLPLVIPPFFGSVFFVILARQFMLDIPSELSDAAKIDGASHWQILTQIMLPLLKPLLAIIATLQFTWTWVDFLGPLIYLRNPDSYTLAVSLYTFFGQNGTQWGPLMAACTLFAIPAVLVFIAGQRFFIAPDLSSGLK